MKQLLLFNITFFSLVAYSNHQEIFSTIYKYKYWGVNEKGIGSSGVGSTAKNTEIYRQFIESFLQEKNIRSVVDLGCGDWEFSQLIDWTGINYLGLDIVPSVIEQNIRSFSSDTIQFKHSNALQESLPSADLLICKDVLQHLPNSDIIKIINQFYKYKYCLITNGTNSNLYKYANPGTDIGDYQPVDLTQPPFNLIGTKVLTYRSGNFTMETLLIGH